MDVLSKRAPLFARHFIYLVLFAFVGDRPQLQIKACSRAVMFNLLVALHIRGAFMRDILR